MLLFKQCKKTNKCLFAAGCGMQFLVYFCASNFAHLDIIEGRENRAALES